MNYGTNVLNGLNQVKPLRLHRTAGAVYPTAKAGGHYEPGA
jgi:hypothetical protein